MMTVMMNCSLITVVAFPFLKLALFLIFLSFPFIPPQLLKRRPRLNLTPKLRIGPKKKSYQKNICQSPQGVGWLEINGKSHEIEAVLPRGESDDQRRCCEIDPMVYPLNSLLMEIITDVRQPESAERGGGLNESPRVRRQSHPGAITREFRIPSSTDPTNQPTNERRVSSSTLALTPHHPLLWYLIATQPPSFSDYVFSFKRRSDPSDLFRSYDKPQQVLSFQVAVSLKWISPERIRRCVLRRTNGGAKFSIGFHSASSLSKYFFFTRKGGGRGRASL
jgi:hypothetical protein